MDRTSEPSAFADLTIRRFVQRLASSEPVPGGGSASALAGALGAALVEMVAGLSRGRPKYAPYQPTLSRCAAVGHFLAGEFLALADRDAAAYAAYASALKLPRETESEIEARTAAVSAAARGASEVPCDVVRACLGLAEAAEAMAGRSNLNASSDLLVAGLLAEASARGAAENVRINLPATGDEDYAEETRHFLDDALHTIDAMVARSREAVLSGSLRDPEGT